MGFGANATDDHVELVHFDGFSVFCLVLLVDARKFDVIRCACITHPPQVNKSSAGYNVPHGLLVRL